MAHLANLNTINETLPAIPKFTINKQKIKRSRATIIAFSGKKNDENQPLMQTTRRLALSLGSISLIANSGHAISLAEDNGFWQLDFPLISPSAENKIANEKTGTRSFIKKGLFMADIGVKGSMYRLRKCSFDLLAMEGLIGADTLNYVRKYLRLKSTFMYFDFDKVISAASLDDKQPLTDLANRLFDKFEELEDASRRKNLSETESSYKGTKVILQEVMDRMPDMI
ncbi:photosynthetic NDH subunit of lumenal location 3, chloroplastic [Mercurialis annua]|uniref:photosynthetic NDH subunit of lumenal location 3, chloroplastic n=1 Tax=Mercurialis annua TaxID=3986 RepID=UPI00215F2CD6|nr:photosynthetic NDH subunit of lumenal location 3, chloroplastic [Mercurialis annua]